MLDHRSARWHHQLPARLSRCSRSPSPARSRAGSSTRWCTIRCARRLFTASRGAGAHLDNRRMRVSKARTLEGALIATGFPYRANMRYLDAYLAMLKAVTRARPPACAARARRRSIWLMSQPGASMRSGRSGLSPWDTAAGTLADPGGRRPHRHAHRRRIPPGRAHRRGHAQGVRGAGGDARAARAGRPARRVKCRRRGADAAAPSLAFAGSLV